MPEDESTQFIASSLRGKIDFLFSVKGITTVECLKKNLVVMSSHRSAWVGRPDHQHTTAPGFGRNHRHPQRITSGRRCLLEGTEGEGGAAPDGEALGEVRGLDLPCEATEEGHRGLRRKARPRHTTGWKHTVWKPFPERCTRLWPGLTPFSQIPGGNFDACFSTNFFGTSSPRDS